MQSAPWAVLDIFDDVNEAENYFTTLFTSVCEDHIPHKMGTIRPKDKPWMSKEIKRAIRHRDRRHKKWKQNRTEQNELLYKNARHEVNVLKFYAKLEHERIIAEKLTNKDTSAKEYWHLTKLVYGNKVKSSIPSIIDGGKVYTDANSKANLFNNHFVEKSKLPGQLPELP